jgi:hypothetical protein
MMRFALALAALALLAVAGCMAGPPAGTGVQGTVFLGPTCPVQRDPPDPQCADRPYAADLALTTPDGRLAKTFSSDANGTFRVDVEPGTYIIRSAQQDAPSHPACSSTDGSFVVAAGAYTTVQVSCDTGIR